MPPPRAPSLVGSSVLPLNWTAPPDVPAGAVFHHSLTSICAPARGREICPPQSSSVISQVSDFPPPESVIVSEISTGEKAEVTGLPSMAML